MILRIEKAEVLRLAALLVADGAPDEARALIERKYPFRPQAPLAEAVRDLGLPTPTVKPSASRAASPKVGKRRKLAAKEIYEAVARDNFRCVYSGAKLIIPPALLTLSLLLPDAFPCASYPNCPLKTTHIGMWALFPSLDHVEAFASGGACSTENLRTASSAVNMFKSSASLEDLGWPQPVVHPNPDGWDGLTSWFLCRSERTPEVLSHSEYAAFFAEWRTAILKSGSGHP